MALDGLPHNNVLGDDGSRGDVVYEIDGEDRLISVNEPWSHFARANHAAYLADSSILERSLWEFIADRETRMIYGMLFERVRSEGKS